ncbi:MAG: peptide-methionine (S)-S-oxide reductase MsrA [Christensenellales bacterium]
MTWESKELPLETLLELFYNIIDPTSLNKQGLDAGTQYRTGIYTVDDADLAVARRSLEKLQTRFDKPVVVECQPLDSFYTAEEYHQKYLDRNPNGYCHVSLGMIQKAKAWKPGDPTTL